MVRVTTSRPEIASAVSTIPNGIHFALPASPFMDGVDFEAGDGGCVQFQLELDAGTGPATITVGMFQKHPAQATFVLCP